MNKQRLFLVTLGIVVIGGLEGFALSKGIDGAALAGSIGAICALGSWHVKALKDKRKE